METLATPETVCAMINSYVRWRLSQDGREGEKYTLKIEPKDIYDIIEEVERQVQKLEYLLLLRLMKMVVDEQKISYYVSYLFYILCVKRI